MIKTPLSRNHYLIDINIKNILCMLLLFKCILSNKKKLFGLIKLIYMFVLIIQYIFIYI